MLFTTSACFTIGRVKSKQCPPFFHQFLVHKLAVGLLDNAPPIGCPFTKFHALSASGKPVVLPGTSRVKSCRVHIESEQHDHVAMCCAKMPGNAQRARQSPPDESSRDVMLRKFWRTRSSGWLSREVTCDRCVQAAGASHEARE